MSPNTVPTLPPPADFDFEAPTRQDLKPLSRRERLSLPDLELDFEEMFEKEMT